MKDWHCNAHFRDKGTEAQLADQVLNTVRWATLQARCQTRESKRMTLSLELCPWKLPVQWGECLIEWEKYGLLRLMTEIRIKWWRARAQRASYSACIWSRKRERSGWGKDKGRWCWTELWRMTTWKWQKTQQEDLKTHSALGNNEWLISEGR